MKKVRIMLTMAAIVFAVAAAVGGSLLPVTQGYYKQGSFCNQAPTDQENCQYSEDTQYPVCTITLGGTSRTAHYDNACLQPLRQIPQ